MSFPRIANGLLVCSVFLLPASALAADPLETAIAVCATCHGVDGNSTDPRYPKIAGMDQVYLLRQLRAFASGQRRDETMAGILATIDPGDFPRLARYYSERKPTPGKVSDPELAARGKVLYHDDHTANGGRSCAGCHQPDGQGNARFPRVAGQHQAYALKQLEDFRSGRRATDRQMTAVAKGLTDEEMKALVEYMAGL